MKNKFIVNRNKINLLLYRNKSFSYAYISLKLGGCFATIAEDSAVRKVRLDSVRIITVPPMLVVSIGVQYK